MRDELTSLLQSLQEELQIQGRWESTPPSERALCSTQPFAVDTLDFDQWLQWILLPKMHDLLRRQLPLPGNCAMRPMAEEVYLDADQGSARIVALLGEIDDLLSTGCGGLN